MQKIKTFIAASAIAVAATYAPSSVAQVTDVGETTTTTLPVEGSSLATNGTYNFKSFEVDAPEAGTYYTEFWLLPAKYANNAFTTFLVYLNDEYVGSIAPTFGNWQTARVEGHETLYLSEGRNEVTVATLAPEFPAVETIKVARNDADAVISSDAYDNYLEDAVADMSYYVPQGGEMSVMANAPLGAPNSYSQQLPLNYTFYKIFNFTQGQQIYITTSSAVPHKIDAMFYGTPYEFRPNITNGDSLVLNPGKSFPGTLNPGSFPSDSRLKLAYTHATSEEMQGYGWVSPSEKTLNSSSHVATMRLDVPKTGMYLIRVRHTVSGASSVADVTVNGMYFYENAPISLAYFDYKIPSDGKKHASMTLSYDLDKDDPLLFIHGGGCDRIVGYNDDGPKDKNELYELSSKDSYISQKYFMKTSGISVSNYSSLDPQSFCTVYADINEETPNLSKSKGKNVSSKTFSNSNGIVDTTVISIPATVNGTLSISGPEKIESISVYGVAGNCIGTVAVDKLNISIPIRDLMVTTSGIYIVCIKTTSGMISKKFAVR